MTTHGSALDGKPRPWSKSLRASSSSSSSKVHARHGSPQRRDISTSKRARDVAKDTRVFCESIDDESELKKKTWDAI